MAKQTPKEKFPVGRGVAAAVWENSGHNGTWYNVTISRTYKDKDGKLQATSSFSNNDLPFVEKAAAEAFAYLLERSRGDRTDESDAAE